MTKSQSDTQKGIRVKIMGKIWWFRRLPQLKKLDGWCDNPWAKNKQIAVWSRLRGLRELDTIIHECLHAGFNDLKEESIDGFASDLARILWRLGYRKEDLK